MEHVAAESPACKAGVKPGDVVEAINGTPLQDLIQLQYEAAEEHFTLTVRRDQDRLNLEVNRRFGEELGVQFHFPIGDRIHTCNNKCVFCFIHQMPKRMRRSLYLMDDDYRLSFLHGHYVTLTNLQPGEFERICEQGLSPMYVSVHATDPELRGRMLGRSEPCPVLDQLTALADHSISTHAQVVLCPGWNDGLALDRTIRELADLHPRASGRDAGVLSLAIVPVGLTKHRERLTPLRAIDGSYARDVLDYLEDQRATLKARLGTYFVFPSDEWFFYAQREFPSSEWYEQFPQYENGIGTCRTFLDEVDMILRRVRPPSEPIRATLITAVLPQAIVRRLANGLNGLQNVDLNVCVVRNEFFGPLINVAGLMTGSDILERIAERDVRDLVFVPEVCLNQEGLLLDDIPAEQLSELSGKEVRFVEPTPVGFCRAIGCLDNGSNRPY